MGIRSRPRVLLVTTSTGAAGAERVVASLAGGLEGYEVEVVYLTGEASAYDLELEAQGIYVLRLEGRRHRPFDLIRKLRSVVQSRQPDLIHSHLFHANVLVSKALRADPKIPLIHTAHIIEGRHRPLRPWFERRAALRASRVVCVSKAVADHLHSCGWADDKLVIVPNGIDSARYLDVPEVGETADPLVVGIGRLHAQKGFDLLLHAFARIASAVPQARLHIAGVGAEAGSLAGLASKLGIADRLTWLGFRSDIPAVMASARVVAFPSRYEGFGLVLAEAGAASRPVVAFDLPTTREIVEDGVTGRIVPFGDVDAFAQALADVLCDPALASRQGQAARARIQGAFGEPRMLAAYAELYAELPALPAR